MGGELDPTRSQCTSRKNPRSPIAAARPVQLQGGSARNLVGRWVGRGASRLEGRRLPGCEVVWPVSRPGHFRFRFERPPGSGESRVRYSSHHAPSALAPNTSRSASIAGWRGIPGNALSVVDHLSDGGEVGISDAIQEPEGRLAMPHRLWVRSSPIPEEDGRPGTETDMARYSDAAGEGEVQLPFEAIGPAVLDPERMLEHRPCSHRDVRDQHACGPRCEVERITADALARIRRHRFRTHALSHDSGHFGIVEAQGSGAHSPKDRRQAPADLRLSLPDPIGSRHTDSAKPCLRTGSRDRGIVVVKQAAAKASSACIGCRSARAASMSKAGTVQ